MSSYSISCMNGSKASTTGIALCREGTCWQNRIQLCNSGKKGLSSFISRISTPRITSAKEPSVVRLSPCRRSLQCPDHTPIALGMGHSFLATKPRTSSSTTSSAASTVLSPRLQSRLQPRQLLAARVQRDGRVGPRRPAPWRTRPTQPAPPSPPRIAAPPPPSPAPAGTARSRGCSRQRPRPPGPPPPGPPPGSSSASAKSAARCA